MPRLKTYVIIVTYNGGEWISNCIKSTTPYPVIVVDNCSTDKTREIIKTNFPNVELLEQNVNLGFGKANNIGISYALKKDADFVFLLNQDAYLQTKTIESLIKIYNNNTQFGILSPLHLNREKKSFEKIFEYYLKKGENKFLFDSLFLKDVKEVYELSMVNAAAWLIPKKTLEFVGGFNPMFFLYGEDDNYCQRVLYHGFKIGICPKTFIVHDSNLKYHMEPEKGSDEYFRKFLNRIKVKYADVNAENYKKLHKAKHNFFKIAIKEFLKLNFKNGQLFYKKYKYLNKLNFENMVVEQRLKGRHYLN